MQVNNEVIQSLEAYEPTTIAAISNQVLKTIYTKDRTKVKLKTNFSNYKVIYKLSGLNADSYNSDVFQIVDNQLIVNRIANETFDAKLSVYLIDNSKEVYVNSWELHLLTAAQAETYVLQEMRYNNNKISYTLGLLGILFALFAAIVIFNSVKPSWQTLVFMLITIAMILIGFLASEKVKTYKLSYVYVLFALGVICAILIFWLPLNLMIQYGIYTNALDMQAAGDTSQNWQQIASDASNFLGAPIAANDTVRQAMLPTSGYVRGIIIIIGLVLAAICDILGAIIAYFKTTKLNKYLDSLQAEKK